MRLIFYMTTLFFPVLSSSCVLNATVSGETSYLLHCTNENGSIIPNGSWNFNGNKISPSAEWRAILPNGSLEIYSPFYWDVGGYECCSNDSCSCITSLNLTDSATSLIKRLRYLVPKNISLMSKGSVYWMPNQLQIPTEFEFHDQSTELICNFVIINIFADLDISWTSSTDISFEDRILQNNDQYVINTSSYECPQPSLKMRNATCYRTSLTLMKPPDDMFFACRISQFTRGIEIQSRSREFRPILRIPGKDKMEVVQVPQHSDMFIPEDMFDEIELLEAERKERREAKTMLLLSFSREGSCRYSLLCTRNNTFDDDSLDGYVDTDRTSLDLLLVTSLSDLDLQDFVLPKISNTSLQFRLLLTSRNRTISGTFLLKGRQDSHHYILCRNGAHHRIFEVDLSNCSEATWVTLGFRFIAIFIVHCIFLIVIATICLAAKRMKKSKKVIHQQYRETSQESSTNVVNNPSYMDQSEFSTISFQPSPQSCLQARPSLNYAELDFDGYCENQKMLLYSSESGYEVPRSSLNMNPDRHKFASLFPKRQSSLALSSSKELEETFHSDFNSTAKPPELDKQERRDYSLSESLLYRTSKHTNAKLKRSSRTPPKKLMKYKLRSRCVGALSNSLISCRLLDISKVVIKKYLAETNTKKLSDSPNNLLTSTKRRPEAHHKSRYLEGNLQFRTKMLPETVYATISIGQKNRIRCLINSLENNH